MLLDNSQSRSSSWDQDHRNWAYLNLLSNVKREEDLQAISMAELVPTRAANASSDMALENVSEIRDNGSLTLWLWEI
jgi:hypothetical protein